MLKLHFFKTQLVINPTCFDLDHLQGVNKNQYSAYKKKPGLIIKYIKSVHKMPADITKFVRCSVQLVQNIRRLKLYVFLQWFISGACQVYVLVAIRH